MSSNRGITGTMDSGSPWRGFATPHVTAIIYGLRGIPRRAKD